MPDPALWARLRAWVKNLDLLPKVVGGLTTATLLALLPIFWQKPMTALIAFLVVAGISAILLVGRGIIGLAARIKRIDERGERGLVPATARPVPIAVTDPGKAVLRVMGVDVGRTKTFCGFLEVPASAAFGLPGYTVKPSRAQEIAVGIGRDVYPRIVEAARVVAGQVGRLDGIGIGVPGQIDASDGVILRSPAGFPHGEPFVETLIDEIARCTEVLQALGIHSREVHEAERHALRNLIHLDNDVNCGARVVLNSHVDNKKWNNFACIFVGTGVGAGLVLNKEMFYGGSGAAGEIGHTLVGGLRESSDGSTQNASCACGHEGDGIHWETLVNGSGLVDICRTVDQRLLDALRDGSAKGPTALTITLAAARCFGSEGHLAKLAGQTQPLPATFDCAGFKDSLSSVVDRHAEYLAAGIGNLGNLLNLDHVVLGGGLMDGLMSLPLYREKVHHHLRTYLLEVPFTTLRGRVEAFPEARARCAWQGGALMFFDRSYLNYRNGASKILDG